MLLLRTVAWGTLCALVAFLVGGISGTLERLPALNLSGPSMLLGGFILFMGWIVAAYSARNLRGQERLARFAFLLGVAVLSLWLMVVAEALVVIALAWTISGLAVAALVAHSGTVRARMAARQVAVRLLVGDLALWAAVLLLVADGTAGRSELTSAPLVVAAMLAAAGVVRSALVPTWRWLPLTAEAPSPVSALLHAGVVNGLGLLAVLFWPVFEGARPVLLALAAVGLVTAVLATAAMRLRPDVKGKLASSTSAQMGYMAVQIGLGLPAFAMLHLVGHGFYKGWLFLRAGGTPQRLPAAEVNVRPAQAVALAGLATGTVALAVTTWPDIMVVDAVPLAAAAAAAAMAMAVLARPDRRTAAVTSAGARRIAAAIVLLGLFGYVALLGMWARWFEFAGAWSGWAAVAVTILVLGLGAAGLVAAGSGRLWRLVQPSVIDTTTRVRGRIPQSTIPATPGSPELLAAAAKVVSPMWPVESAVAVNPLHDVQELAFDHAAKIAADAWGARAYFAECEYLSALQAGRFTEADLAAAATGTPLPADVAACYLIARVQWQPNGAADFMADHLLSGLSDEQIAQVLPQPRPAARTMGEQVGLERQVSGLANAWTALLVGEPGMWARFQDRVQDLGLRGLRQTVQSLPTDPVNAIASMLEDVVPHPVQVAYLSRLLARDSGWAAHVKHADEASLADLVAIRVCFDVLVARTRGSWHWEQAPACDLREWAQSQIAPLADLLGLDDPHVALELASHFDERGRLRIWQRAWENRYRNRLVDRVTTRAAEPETDEPAPVAQVVMCIDVRSERMRRHIEAVGHIATYGYAGFFGLMVRHETASGDVSDQCPVLVRPEYLITEDDSVSHAGLPRAIRQAMSAVAAAPGTGFAMAEAVGTLAGLDAVVQTAAPGPWGKGRNRMQPDLRGDLHVGQLATSLAADDLQWGISVAQRAGVAASMLRALGIVEEFSDTLLLVGHAATVENNAFAAAYDCGACGGHGGHVNARIMSAILNDSRVRRLLRTEHGLDIPDRTVAVPAWHNTTTDAITIDPEDVPPSHTAAVAALTDELEQARDAVLAERLAELPDAGRKGQRAAAARAADWAQPQPEWGLAGNAAFVIGPRSLTRGLNLRGRVFLHSYEPGLDVDGSILETLLTAPMQVTQWINNQYYFSVVDPERFGAGDKTTHNAVGGIGVLTGAAGDLRVGLPWQAVYTAAPVAPGRWNHEPMRLLVLVYASREDISSVLENHPNVANLITNEWISLAAIDPQDDEAYSLGTDLTWSTWLIDEHVEEFEMRRG